MTTAIINASRTMRARWRTEARDAHVEYLVRVAVRKGVELFNPEWVDICSEELHARINNGRIPSPLPDEIAMWLLSEVMSDGTT